MSEEENDRLEFVAELTLLGHSPESIASRLGVGVKTIEHDLQTIRIKWQKSTKKTYTEFVAEELAVEGMLLKHLEIGIKSGSWKHIETALKITERRARIVGLDHTDRMEQARVEIESRQLDLMAQALEAALTAIDISDEQREIATFTLLKALEEPAALDEIEDAEIVDDLDSLI
jgi:hypothetical protein